MKYIFLAVFVILSLDTSSQFITSINLNFKPLFLNNPILNTIADENKRSNYYLIENVHCLKNLIGTNSKDNSIQKINFENYHNSRYIDCESNQITSLNLNNLPSLKSVNSNFETMTELDMDFGTSVKVLGIKKNENSQLTKELNIPSAKNKCPNLSRNFIILNEKKIKRPFETYVT